MCDDHLCDSHCSQEYVPALSRGETHDPVHGSFINLMKLPNVGQLIFDKSHQTISCFNVVLLMNGCLL